MGSLYPLRQMQRVYCAGPLFNDAERREMLRIADVLAEAGFEPFVPHADGMEFALVQPYLTSQGYDPATAGQLLHDAIFALDTYQVVVDCGSLVMNLNGRVPDEGAVAELTMAWMLGKPLVIYKEDARSAISGRDNPLVVGQSDFEVIDQIDRLGEALAQQIADHPLTKDYQAACPPKLTATVAAGEALWRRLCALGTERPCDLVAEIVLDLFADRHQSLTKS